MKAIAYVTVPASDNWRWIGKDPADAPAVSGVDTRYVTHVNFAFGMIKAYQFDPNAEGRPLMCGSIASQDAYLDPSDGKHHYRVTADGWIEEMSAVVNGSRYLKALAALKEQKPELKVLLSVGGWDSDGFCYMARTKAGRAEFIESCIGIINEFGIDGIDIDWEFPVNGGWGAIASCGHCVDDAKSLLKEFRAAFDTAFPGEHKLLSAASGAAVPWVDSETFQALDYMNVMCYDYNLDSDGSHSDLEESKNYMKNHTEMVGDTQENRLRINFGVPFYNGGAHYLVPYRKSWQGFADATPEITRTKMEWVISEGYGGAFYWAYSMDVFEQDTDGPDDPKVEILQRTVFETLFGKK